MRASVAFAAGADLGAPAREGVVVPGGMSVVGYDDSPIARLATADLTTVSQAPEAMAVAAVQAATERLDSGRTAAVDIVLDPHLVVRGTTGPPANHPPSPRVDVLPRAGARGNTSTGEWARRRASVRQPPGP